MKTKSARVGAFALLGLSLFAGAARAQIGAGGMPDLSDFAGAIARKAEAAPPKKTAPVPKTGFASGLTVPRVKPGEVARNLGRDLRLAIEEKSGPQPAFAELEKAMPAVLTAIEKAFPTLGFASRDMGTAYAYAFLDLHENATGKKISDATTKVAARTLSSAVASAWGAKWKTLPAAEKEKLYEGLIMATTLNTLLTQQFAEAGKTEEVAAMREGSAQLFEQLVGVAPSQVKIASNGQISGLRDNETTKK